MRNQIGAPRVIAISPTIEFNFKGNEEGAMLKLQRARLSNLQETLKTMKCCVFHELCE